MRELAHLRWSIENHAFRALNEATNSKHVWPRGAKAERTLVVLMLAMFLAYHHPLDMDHPWETFRLRRFTLRHLVDGWILSLPDAGGTFAPVG